MGGGTGGLLQRADGEDDSAPHPPPSPRLHTPHGSNGYNTPNLACPMDRRRKHNGEHSRTVNSVQGK